jgi:hypothetical protein
VLDSEGNNLSIAKCISSKLNTLLRLKELYKEADGGSNITRLTPPTPLSRGIFVVFFPLLRRKNLSANSWFGKLKYELRLTFLCDGLVVVRGHSFLGRCDHERTSIKIEYNIFSWYGSILFIQKKLKRFPLNSVSFKLYLYKAQKEI